MPCVFPSWPSRWWASRACRRRRGHRMAGLAYTAGVVVSFLALGGADAGAARRRRATGLGLPAAVAAGGGRARGAVHADRAEPRRRVRVRFAAALVASQSAQVRHPVGNAFLSGVLAVAIASPCTAPFMGASLGLAISLPAAQALLMFAGLGLGMALPYLLASFGARGGAPAAAARRVDGHLPQADGVPDVRHRRLAGVGAGPAERHRRRRRAAGAAGHAEHAGVGPHAARPHAARAGRAGAGHAGRLAWTIGPQSRSCRRPRPPRRRRWQPWSQAASSSWWPPASRCSSTSPRPGA
jgi:cytochrome c biogenesis protein CcdA